MTPPSDPLLSPTPASAPGPGSGSGPGPAPKPQVLRCSTTADFLAALPRLVGFTAQNSLFVVLFSGSRAGRALRLDLPNPNSPPQITALLSTMSELLQNPDVGRGSRTVALVIASATPLATSADAQGRHTWTALARRLERRLVRDGIRVRELCCLGPDGWISFLDGESPEHLRPLAEIEASPIAQAARASGTVTPDLARLGAIPPGDPVRCEAVVTALAHRPPYRKLTTRAQRSHAAPKRSADSSTSERSKLPPAAAWVSEVSEIGTELLAPTPLSPEATARLIRATADPERWLILAICVLTRPAFARDLTRELSPERFIGVPLGDSAHPAPDVTDSGGGAWSLTHILTVVCADFRAHDRLPPLRTRLTAAVAETPVPLRSGILAFTAWIWWLSGNQTVALRHASEASRLGPEHQFANMVLTLVSRPVHVGARDVDRAAA